MLADDELKRQAEERVGTILEGKWRLDALLGVGGMACVYSATHRNTKRVAVKLLHPHLSFDRSIRERFLREGYAANRVKHPGVVVVHDEDTTQEGAAFLVMELLEGEGVGERWQRHGCRLPPEEVMSLADQLLDTLAAAHEKGIVHRDIKPENLFVTGDGQLKVLDFGIARLRELSGSISATRTGSMLGTPAFMAPEQAKGRWNEVDALTDLWAVGATMFTLITGEYVHQGNTANEMLALTITRPARSIGSLTPDLHPALVALVDKALAYHKHERWSDAGAMRKALSIARIEVARSGGPFAGGAVLATTNYDATISPRPRVRASPDAATVHSEDHSRPASTPSASTTARSPTIAGRIVRLRFLVASVTGVLVVAVLAVLLRPSAKEPEPMTGSGLARPEITNIPQAAVPAVMPSGVSLPSVAMVVEDAGLSAEADAGAAKTLAADRPHAAKPRRRPGEPAPGATAPAKASSDPFARRR